MLLVDEQRPEQPIRDEVFPAGPVAANATAA